MKIKIFWQKNCPNCIDAKNLEKQLEEKILIQYHNIESVDGLAEACLYNVFSTPSVVIVDNSGNEIKAWRGKVPCLEEIKKEIEI